MVFPAPGGATTTALGRAASEATISGTRGSMGKVTGKRITFAQVHATKSASCFLESRTWADGKSLVSLLGRLFFAISCSQTLITVHPDRLSVRAVWLSRAIFLAIFAVQYGRCVFGKRQCFGQPCQKHPSTKTQTRSPGKTKSGLPETGKQRRHPLIPALLNRLISRSSVERFPLDRTFDMMRERVSLVTLSTEMAIADSLESRSAWTCPSPRSQRDGYTRPRDV